MSQLNVTSKQLIVFATLLVLAPMSIYANVAPARDVVDIEFVLDHGEVLRQFPTSSSGSNGLRAYLEAINGENYSIRVYNPTAHRVGLVVAVDGRNIISGQKSHLGATEPMYVLDPYSQATYSGWRTSQDQVHRFYFTDEDNSYAGAFGDFSAMGVAAVAVFQEKQNQAQQKMREFRSDQGSMPDSAEAPAAQGRVQESLKQPGTGFGNKQWSPVTRVRFRPQRHPVAKYFVKYEWRETLCRKAVIRCGHEPNRFWSDRQPAPEVYGEFAPYPPSLW